jgi:hypothetical protein
VCGGGQGAKGVATRDCQKKINSSRCVCGVGEGRGLCRVTCRAHHLKGCKDMLSDVGGGCVCRYSILLCVFGGGGKVI